jgi:peptidoglycan/LPS O-acetylase OafA/YrhL
MAPDAKPSAIPALTGVRFIAALLVLVGHSSTIIRFGGSEPLWHVCLTQLTGVGMPLFFVLSGFVIQYNYSETIHSQPLRGTFNFFVARFARLYPMYFVILCLDLFLNGYFENWTGPVIVHSLKIGLPSYLLLVQSWHYQIVGEHSLIFAFPTGMQITWSISTEWFFYLCYPVLCIVFVRLRRIRTTLWAVAAITVLGYASVHLAYLTWHAVDNYAVWKYGQVAGGTDSADSFVFWLYYLSPYPRLFEFIIGALAAVLFKAVRDVPISRREALFGRVLLTVAVGAIAVVYLALFNPSGWLSGMFIFDDALILRMYFTFAPFIAALLFCCARYRSWIAVLLSRPWIVLCGEASYSIYLIHIMIVQYVKVFEQSANVPPSRLHGLVTVVIVMLIVISVSLVTYRTIEVPARRMLRRKLSLERSRFAKPEVRQSGPVLATAAE